jgi:hypothetical protein
MPSIPRSFIALLSKRLRGLLSHPERSRIGEESAVKQLLLRNPHPPGKTVISTEAAHSIIVSSAAEKSASLPPPFANPHRALVLVSSFAF